MTAGTSVWALHSKHWIRRIRMSNEYKDWQAEEIKELEAQVARLEKWQDIVRHYSRDAAMYADERMPISHWAELDA